MSECYTDVYVARYEVYPNVDPTGYCVGFRLQCTPNNLSGYWDTVVLNADIPAGATTDDIVTLGYNALSGTIVPWAESNAEKSSIIGDKYTTIEEAI